MFLYAKEMDFLLIGSTSNLYIKNTTDIPIVISTLKCNRYQIEENQLLTECGVQVSTLSRQMITQGIKGFEYLTKLPGTIGASIYNNSSVISDENSITSLLVDVKVITPSGIRWLKKEDLHLSFRSSDLKKKIIRGVILQARLKVEYDDVEKMKAIANANELLRNKILEGPAHNLGCTVHRMFCKGRMPARYRIPLMLYVKAISLITKDDNKVRSLKKRFLLIISGHRRLIPYVSSKQLIIFLWRKEEADKYFDEYIKFMNDVCMTDQVEIEVI